MVTALTAQGMRIMHLFVVQVIVGNYQATLGATQYSENKQTNNIFTPSGDRYYQLLLATYRMDFLEEKIKFSLCF